ncbi:MAG: hypothetical protein AAGA22_09685 [Pseudomonadota bacterium]
MRYWVFACITAAAVWFLPGAAAAVTYNEAVDGDLDENTSIIALDIGQNTIIGSVTGTFTFTDTFVDLDGFRITLPTGARIVSGSLTVNNYDINIFIPNPFFPFTVEIVDSVLFDIGPPSGFVQYYKTDNPSFDFLAATGPVTRDILETQMPGEGRPLTARINAGSFAGGGDSFSVDYNVSLDVAAAVPLPAGIVLLLSALVGIAFVHRKAS